jgi:hypothetical protein
MIAVGERKMDQKRSSAIVQAIFMIVGALVMLAGAILLARQPGLLVALGALFLFLAAMSVLNEIKGDVAEIRRTLERAHPLGSA